MHHWQFSSRHVRALGVVALLMLPPAGAFAAPKRLNCSLTDLETKAGSNSDVAVENRSIVIVYDEQAMSLTVHQDGSARALNNVTISQTSINGYVGEISVGIDSASLTIVFQTYGPDSTRTEFGQCSPSMERVP